MKKILIALSVLLIFLSFKETETVRGKLESSDTVTVNIIKSSPEQFPVVSVIFEAVKFGKPIFDLKKESIRVTENDVPCKVISLDPISENYPVNVSLVVDHSGSMLFGEVTVDTTGEFPVWKLVDTIPPIKHAKTAVSSFVKRISNKKDSVQIVGFASTVDLYSGFSSDKKYLQSVIDKLEATDMTAFLDAVNFSLDSIRKHGGIKVVVALTDGQDNSSHVSIKEVIKKSKDLKIPVYTIGLGNVNKKFLAEISESTGGAFYYTNNSSALDSIYTDIQKRIHAIYDLRYESDNLNVSDTIRKIKIEFTVDSSYLKNNLADLYIPQKTIEYIYNKKQKQKYLIGGISITAVCLTAGIIVYRRKRKKGQQ